MAESSPPDAIIVDLRLPDLDGLDFLRRLRGRDETRHTPVAIVTGDYLFGGEKAAELEQLGAVVHFKPLWIEDLARLVHGLLNPS